MINGANLGGTMPLTKSDIEKKHPAGLPQDLWIADLSDAALK